MRKTKIFLTAPVALAMGLALAGCNPFARDNQGETPAARVVSETSADGATTDAGAPAAATTADGAGGKGAAPADSSAAPAAPAVAANSGGVTDNKSGPAASSGGHCTDGRNRHVMVINDTQTTLYRLFGSNVNRTSWEEDVLGSRVLSAGERIDVNWDDGTCMCNFDLKAEFSDGTETVRRNFNVCTESAWRIVE